MNPDLLIDSIVRQTTVLIAQLATATGGRAPLAHTANQVFTDLIRELKEQGVGNKVIADMFGDVGAPDSAGPPSITCRASATFGSIPEPDSSLNCSVIPIPTPSNELFYCCPCTP